MTSEIEPTAQPEEEQTPVQETAEEAESIHAKAAELPAEPIPAKGSAVGRFFRHIFSPATRTGKIVRPILRGLAVTVGFFALGVLLTYLALYQPIEKRYQETKAGLEQAQADLKVKQQELDEAALTFIGAQAERNQAVDMRATLEGRLLVWQGLSKVSDVRLALAKKDTAAAKLALTELEKHLTASVPEWEKMGAAQATTFNQVLALVKDDISRNATLADQDLQRLVSELMLVEQTLGE
ncbi:MAG: hypothetical protein JW987_09840 [Anaerolineaceae bacterium]|nr:hypothetical protein [Anaerolineaceae bacterium]